MPRPRKCRRVCDYPQTLTFLPEDHKNREQVVILTVDEYETIRLIDKEGLSQEQCGDFMQVARTTVQQIYASARKKLADVLVDGLPLRIEGGDYQLCNGGNRACGCSNCYKQKFNQLCQTSVSLSSTKIFNHHSKLRRTPKLLKPFTSSQ
mgnify:CR=1 FL=1